MRTSPSVLGLALTVAGCGASASDPPAHDAGVDADAQRGRDASEPPDLDAGPGGGLDASVDAGYEDCLGRCGDELSCCDDAFGLGVRGCVDPLQDPHNCGRCGVRCRDDEQCLLGTCGCPGGECAGACVDLTWDAANCGVCDNRCGDATSICFLGSCRSCEGTGGLSCGDQCPRVLEDEAACGACDVACAEDEQCLGGGCVGGDCDFACSEDWVCCDLAWDWGVAGCTSLEWDGFNCGACGVVCAEGSTCVRGLCVESACEVACGFGQNCCAGAWGGPDEGCTSVEWDPTNCGACGVTCTGGEVCASGVCRVP